MRNALGTIAVVCALAAAMPAGAQVDPELGDVGEGEPEPAPATGFGGGGGGSFGAGGTAAGSFGGQAQPAPAPAPAPQSHGTWQPPTGQVPMNVPPEDEAAGDVSVPGRSDHAAMVGRLGVGFFGILSIPVMGCPNAPAGCTIDGSFGTPLSDLSAPTVGVRYWLDKQLGIEAALGFHHSSGEFQSDFQTGTMTTRVLLGPATPSVTAAALHGGLPITLAHSGHFAFEIVPHLELGVASGSYEGATPSENWDISGFLLQVGGRVGAEIHFGFIDIPQLSLQGSVGLAVRYESRHAEQGGPAPISHDHSVTRITTGVGAEPWDIFTGSISAIYYL